MKKKHGFVVIVAASLVPVLEQNRQQYALYTNYPFITLYSYFVIAVVIAESLVPILGQSTQQYALYTKTRTQRYSYRGMAPKIKNYDV